MRKVPLRNTKGTFHILTDNNNSLNIHSSQLPIPTHRNMKENILLSGFIRLNQIYGVTDFFLFLFKLFKRTRKGRQCWFCQSLDFMSNLQWKIAFRLCHWGFQTRVRVINYLCIGPFNTVPRPRSPSLHLNRHALYWARGGRSALQSKLQTLHKKEL